MGAQSMQSRANLAVRAFHYIISRMKVDKMKIAVYAIAKNESKFVKRFMDSCADADGVFVGLEKDDPSASLFRFHGAQIVEIGFGEQGFRFDEARNQVLVKIPEDYDVCISMDLDEYLEEGWRKKIVRDWKDRTTKLYYRVKLLDGTVYALDRIHSRFGYRWRYPTHECAVYIGSGEEVRGDSDLTITHTPDVTKDRSKDLRLLKICVDENPLDPRSIWYYARQLSIVGRYYDAIDQFKHYLSMFREWETERAWACIFIGQAYQHLDDPIEALSWFYTASCECTRIRCGLFYLAELLHSLGQHKKAAMYFEQALKIVDYDTSFMHRAMQAHNETIHILLAECYKSLENEELRALHLKKARNINPSIEI